MVTQVIGLGLMDVLSWTADTKHNPSMLNMIITVQQQGPNNANIGIFEGTVAAITFRATADGFCSASDLCSLNTSFANRLAAGGSTPAPIAAIGTTSVEVSAQKNLVLSGVPTGTADAGDSVAVSPLAVPLITGPATISTMIIYAEKSPGLADQALLVGYAFVGALATFACLAASERITRLLGQTGINVMTRLMGLVLAAIGVEIMADGLGKLFPALLR